MAWGWLASRAPPISPVHSQTSRTSAAGGPLHRARRRTAAATSSSAPNVGHRRRPGRAAAFPAQRTLAVRGPGTRTGAAAPDLGPHLLHVRGVTAHRPWPARHGLASSPQPRGRPWSSTRPRGAAVTRPARQQSSACVAGGRSTVRREAAALARPCPEAPPPGPPTHSPASPRSFLLDSPRPRRTRLRPCTLPGAAGRLARLPPPPPPVPRRGGKGRCHLPKRPIPSTPAARGRAQGTSQAQPLPPPPVSVSYAPPGLVSRPQPARLGGGGVHSS